ncbi:MAG: hypothetical protein CMF80_05480 [Candidatus Marinimicrobia bacterium]|nr:hypothetical protein [Candidatus Neomarinimicrobiota bacterium]|tara:strand:+ start:1876 stop:3150 length:1275 start_codon:yes stop_codon:yes gene_type:complete
MNIDVIMPKMGESITEGTILEWKKNVGESIKLDETLLEISTDKVDSEIPSPSEGVITEILYNVNDVVQVGEIIAKISKDGNSKVQSILKKEVVKNDNKKETVDSTNFIKTQQTEKKIDTKRFLSPLVKNIAKKENIDLSELDSIQGSGRNNRLNKKDLLNYINSKKNTKSMPVFKEIPNLPSNNSEDILKNDVEKMDRVRLKIGEHMVNSVKTSPHVYSTTEVDMTSIVEMTSQNKSTFSEKYNLKLTYTPFILSACVKAIQDFPLMNAMIDGENIIHQKNINLGIAVALNDGNLIVPALKNSEEKNFLGLTRNAAELASKARNDKLEPDDIFGSTFTVTNPGMFGSLFGMAIINQPNLGILSVGAIKKKPVVKETDYGDVIVVRSMMYITLGYDHRLIDGAYGTRFLAKITENLENFNINEII